ncbi:hydrogenase formation protein HypD [Pectinatus haikarae]|uniref:Hydrogenase expression/formation protein HypD n=1 Tax=Pectinatus haikarae TaxID=349096 RepID=A0ABT9Y3H9_9FIRM|nr:hydrogenase formation protein HypD [Pectinatus haikarae]MDQ0202386.1 hydrogenase expression/formation protein HypD [Pectinatus haikarae]
MIMPEECKKAAEFFLQNIDRLITKPTRFMEVCGTHTVSIFRSGIRQLLPEKVDLVSGPGCPVCVTPNDYMDTAIAYAKNSNVIITTFGDMLKVPGTSTSLYEARAEGADVRIVYSPLDALQLAINNPAKKIIFLAVGFETTAPLTAATIQTAQKKQINNFFILSAHKWTYTALDALLSDPTIKVDGFLLPGHVCVITGEAPFSFVSERYAKPAVIAGFEALDILRAVYMLALQVQNGQAKIENAYKRVVRTEGNPIAQNAISSVFSNTSANWRGFGGIENSGMTVNAAYAQYDALHSIPVTKENSRENPACRCGDVLKGNINPTQCPLFKKICTPEHPAGACMVSIEGTCHAWYKYGQGRYHYGR